MEYHLDMDEMSPLQIEGCEASTDGGRWWDVAYTQNCCYSYDPEFTDIIYNPSFGKVDWGGEFQESWCTYDETQDIRNVPHYADINGDGKAEFICTNRDGWVAVRFRADDNDY